MTDLKRAKDLLQNGAYTCVLCEQGNCMSTTLRGVKPLVQWLQEGGVHKDFSAADKVVGKATAFLYCLLGAKAVYASVMSRPAMEVLQQHGIYTECDRQVENIINRAGDGICPFEEAVLHIVEPETAYQAILAKMEAMGIRVRLDDRNETMGKRIREAQMEKIPYMLIVGAKEQEENTVSVRNRKGEDLGAMSIDEMLVKFVTEINTKAK